MNEPKPITERVAILESRVDSHDQRLDRTQNLITVFFEKLDHHITEEGKHDSEMQKGLVQVTTIVQGLNDNLVKTNNKLDSFSNLAVETDKMVGKVQTVWVTVTKIVMVIAVVISGIWAVYEFAVTHPEQVHLIKGD